MAQELQHADKVKCIYCGIHVANMSIIAHEVHCQREREQQRRQQQQEMNANSSDNEPQQQEPKALANGLDRFEVSCLVAEYCRLLSSSAPGVHHGAP